MPQKEISSFFVSYRRKLEKAIQDYRAREEFWRYLEVALTLFTITFFIVVAIRPAAVTISSLVGQIKQREEVDLKLKKKINAIIIAQERYAQIQEKADLIDSFLPTKFRIGQGLSQVIGSAGQAQVSVGGVNVNDTDLARGIVPEVEKRKKEKGVAANLIGLGFDFKSRGGYSQLKDFIKQLFQVRRWLEVSQYRISKNEDEEGGVLNFSLQGKMFYWLNR